MKIIVSFFLAFICVVSSGCGSGVPPVIKNLGVNFDRYDSETGMAGDFVFSIDYEIGSTEKVFIEFGGLLIDGGTVPEGVPFYHFTYKMPEGTEIVSLIDGIVQSLEYQESHGDYEIHLSPNSGSSWYVIIDHVQNPSVSRGDAVTAGQIIAETTTFLVELDVTDMSSNVVHCLFSYFDPDLKTEYEQKVQNFMLDWETYKGDTEIYDESSMVNQGCLLSMKNTNE
jgi:hypothetical protein